MLVGGCHCRYNDLGGKDQFTAESAQRPVLGLAKGGTLPYPRRLRTGRPTQKLPTGPYAGQECESAPNKGSPIPWLPYDEVRLPCLALPERADQLDEEGFPAFAFDANLLTS